MKPQAGQRMPIPNSERIEFAKNPLVEVIFQISYAPILRIGGESPYQFQEDIVSALPILADAPQLGSDPRSRELMFVNPVPSANTYSFTDKDGTLFCNINSTAMAITTRSYTNWESFFRVISICLDALYKNYQNVLPNRVGLRYVDILRPKMLGFSDVHALMVEMNPNLNPIIMDHELGAETSNHLSQVRLKLADGEAQMRYGVGLDQDDLSDVFIFDSDFFSSDNLDKSTINDHLHRFNHSAGNLFRWAIGPTLIAALQSES